VGHTGVIRAAVTAIETVDMELARIVDAVHERGGTLLITADHGNAETMLTPEGTPHTAHTTNLVPVVLVAAPGSPGVTDISSLAPGRLADIAPTVLALLGIEQPVAMTGTSLARS
ncbi:MAG: 2,3-bisphosphoglycerate-independent phosphoglycerate mutase, partial [Thermoleophilia bacterium]|nr:2,3-bisphosphoglycerate-independent phosphoglycerate mutase [Thermoleophilia bacterium]